MYFNSYAAGYRIQKLRKAHGLTQEEAAIKLNISDRHMRSLEKGTYTPLDLFVEIAVHFDVTLDYLILGKVETKKELELGKKIKRVYVKPEGMHPKKAFSFQVHYGHSKGATPQTGRNPKLETVP